MEPLARRECRPCKGGVPPMPPPEVREYLSQVEGWESRDDRRIHKTFRFADFKEALAFTNRVGELAESQGHHPDILLTWGRVEVDIWTHKIGGLTESDFVLAAKIDELQRDPGTGGA